MGVYYFVFILLFPNQQELVQGLKNIDHISHIHKLSLLTIHVTERLLHVGI